MRNKLQLLDKIDDTFNMKPIFEEVLNEKTGKKEKRVYFEGKFLMYDKINLNKRMYRNEGILQPAVEDFQKIIKSNRAIAEISHPNYLTLNLKEASHIVTELYDAGNNYYNGRAKTLYTPMGRLLEGILADVNIGVSSRGGGDTRNMGNYDDVTDYELNAIDAVYDPSIGELITTQVNESRLATCGVITDTQNMFMKENLDSIIRNTNIVSMRKEAFLKLVEDIFAMAKKNYDLLK